MERDCSGKRKEDNGRKWHDIWREKVTLFVGY